MAKNYYNEELVSNMLLKYQSIVETIEDAKGHKIVVNKTPEIEQLEKDITNEVLKVVKGIVYLYRYDRHGVEYDELEAIGIMSCFQNYLKFDPSAGTSFNFFSLIVKKCLFGVTTRHSDKQKKLVYLEDLGDAVSAKREHNLEQFIYNLRSTLIDIINSHFLAKKRKKYLFITDVICDYLQKMKAYTTKTDLYRFCGEYSLRALDIRQYVRDMKPFYSALSQIIEDEKETPLENQAAQNTLEDNYNG